MQFAEFYGVRVEKCDIVEIDFDDNARFLNKQSVNLTLDNYSVRGNKKEGMNTYNVWSGSLPEFILNRANVINAVCKVAKVNYSTRLLVHGTGEFEWVFNDVVSMWWNLDTDQYSVGAIDDGEIIEVSNMPPHSDIEGAMFEVISVYNKIANSLFFRGNWNAAIFKD